MKGLNTPHLLVGAALLAFVGTGSAANQSGETVKSYDFDNKVHYQQTQLGKDNYEIVIQSDDYKHFANQSMFLLRHADRLCNGRTFMLKVLEGVQEYQRFPTHPRAYQPPLNVLLQCDSKE